MQTRVIFIHGFGENESIFEQIYPNLDGQHLFLNLWSEVGDVPQRQTTVVEFASELVQKYVITASDLIIGHSLGGWIGLHIKAIAQCKLIQIASWSEPDRVISPVKNRNTLYFLAKYGIYLNWFTKWLAVNKGFKGKPSRPIFEQTLEALICGNSANVVNQLRLIFEPVAGTEVLPDLRIHSKADNIIRKPKSDFVEVPGDHFNLVTHPEFVVKAIKNWMDSSYAN
jgi:hypothetical protein